MRKLLSVMLVLATVLGLMMLMPFSASADSLYIKKIVSVVYDDSGSMLNGDGSKRAYANYAMQAFCGMLNSEDQLYVTYMRDAQSVSNYEPEKLDLSASGIQKSVNSIRNHTQTGSTPYQAVEIAFNKLKSVKDSNPNTQYWLVVITDGDFDESYHLSANKKKEFLNDHFSTYQNQKMPNGTIPQITYLGIGSVTKPDAKEGIFTYTAQSSADIISAMSQMADKVSGRTRLQKSDIKQIDDKKISVSSAIPLLNIAAFVQESSATVTRCLCDKTTNVPVVRNVSLSYPGYTDLSGSAFLLGDSQRVIPAGTYEIEFDKTVDIKDVVLLFEPALEMRMLITVNGKQIKDISDLGSASEKDTISISYKIYEMGTDTEISPSLLPEGTQYEVTISEEGKIVQTASGEGNEILDYVLKNIDTELVATMHIKGFNPIRSTYSFTPAKYVPKIVYTVIPSFSSELRSVKFDDIASNRDMSVCFTVCADGVPITDAAAVKALNPTIEISPQGNTGVISYADDGKIVFTPDAAKEPDSHDGSYKVTVTCTLDNGTTASETYTVLLSEYKVIPVNGNKPVKKTKLFQNSVSVSFYITKDGVKLDKTAVQKDILVQLNKEHKDLKTKMTVSEDGTITVTPYSTKTRSMTFGNWFFNWKYYFGLEGEDIKISFNHPFGLAEATVDIVGEDSSYLIWWVYLPLILEIVALIVLALYIYCVVTKPKYLKSAKLYVGDIRYSMNEDDETVHVLTNFSAVELSKFNKLFGYGRLKFKKAADVVDADGIKIRADHGGRIICEMGVSMPWYKGKLEPKNSDYANLKKPADIEKHIEKHRRLEIVEFATTETIEGDHNKKFTPANIQLPRYIVVADPSSEIKIIDDRRVIKTGKIFIYVN